ncbi:MAG: DUF3078 domain-containing protein [Bacteroidales bacterium]|nr:DUF3078 domain-containing protein [Bacteroidales bacterium]
MRKKLFFLAICLQMVGVVGYSQENDVQKAVADAANALSNAPEIAEKVNYWTTSSIFDVGLSSTMLQNWAAGGYNTIAINAGIDANANYKKELMTWGNRLQLMYAFYVSGDKPGVIQKTNDLIKLESAWGYRTSETSKWNYSASLNFRSQFTDSYKFGNPLVDEPYGPNDYAKTLQSGFMSPAYTNIALGMTWTPSAWFSANFAPLTGGFTICDIPILRKTYGMKPIEGTEEYRSSLFQFGAQVTANVKLNINEVFKFETQLVLFSDYLNKPQNIRVNWDNKISWQLNKLFKISFDTWLIYDPIVMIPDEIHPEGIQRIQMKEYLSFNLTYTFAPKK